MRKQSNPLYCTLFLIPCAGVYPGRHVDVLSLPPLPDDQTDLRSVMFCQYDTEVASLFSRLTT